MKCKEVKGKERVKMQYENFNILTNIKCHRQKKNHEISKLV